MVDPVAPGLGRSLDPRLDDLQERALLTGSLGVAGFDPRRRVATLSAAAGSSRKVVQRMPIDDNAARDAFLTGWSSSCVGAKKHVSVPGDGPRPSRISGRILPDTVTARKPVIDPGVVDVLLGDSTTPWSILDPNRQRTSGQQTEGGMAVLIGMSESKPRAGEIRGARDLSRAVEVIVLDTRMLACECLTRDHDTGPWVGQTHFRHIENLCAIIRLERCRLLSLAIRTRWSSCPWRMSHLPVTATWEALRPGRLDLHGSRIDVGGAGGLPEVDSRVLIRTWVKKSPNEAASSQIARC